MKRNPKRPDRTLVLLLSAFPGVGHLLIGKRRRGIHLLVFALAMTLVLLLRWDAFRVALSAPDVGAWVASRFLILAVAASVLFSVHDVRRLLAGPAEERGKSPFQVARRRFAENQLAMAALYAIVIFYLIAVLAPILAPFDPAAIEDVLETRYIAPSSFHLFGTD